MYIIIFCLSIFKLNYLYLLRTFNLKILYIIFYPLIIGNVFATDTDEKKQKIINAITSALSKNTLNPKDHPLEFIPSSRNRAIKTRSSMPTRSREQQSGSSIWVKSEANKQRGESSTKIPEVTDKRIRISQTHNWPASVHGVVIMCITGANADTNKWGSGTLIAPNLVLTAAHNLYLHDLDSKNQPIGEVKVRFIPGMDGSNAPFSEPVVIETYFPESYKLNQKDDYGLLVLDGQVFEMTGYFGLSILPAEEIKTLNINVTGYPLDKQEKKDQYLMYGMHGQVKAVDNEFIDYEIYTHDGQSGSGVYHQDSDGYFVIGTHVLRAQGYNKGTLITEERLKQISQWAAFSIQKKRERMKSSKNVQVIDLSDKDIGDFGVLELLKRELGGFSTLILTNNKIMDEGAKALAEGITFSSMDLGNNKIRDQGARALAKCTTLHSLNLGKNCIVSTGALAIAENTLLTTLSLWGNRIGDDGAKAFSKNFTLMYLDLRSCAIGDESAIALAENLILKSLQLGDNHITNVGANALAKNSTLILLDLACNFHITPEGVKDLFMNTTLKSLDLARNNVNLFAIQALINNTTLTSLNLWGTKISDDGAIALTKNTTLRHLDLRNCDLGDRGAKVLADSTALQSLNLGSNQIRDEGAHALAINNTLTELILLDNKIGDDGARSFGKNTKLKSLNLEDNQIKIDGAKALAKNTTLMSLYLGDNQIKDEGAQAFALNTTLSELSVWGNKIGNTGARALVKTSTLLTLDLESNQLSFEEINALRNSIISSLDLVI